jgi:hypothetical protein
VNKPLRTMRSAIMVPSAEKMTARHIAAFAKAAAHHNVRILLQNGLRISPDGTVDRPGEITPAEANPLLRSDDTTPGDAQGPRSA